MINFILINIPIIISFYLRCSQLCVLNSTWYGLATSMKNTSTILLRHCISRMLKFHTNVNYVSIYIFLHEKSLSRDLSCCLYQDQ